MPPPAKERQKKRRERKKSAAAVEAVAAEAAAVEVTKEAAREAVKRDAEAEAAAHAAPIASLIPAPVPPVVAVPVGSAVLPALALPVLELPKVEADERSCLTRPPPQLPPTLAASGYEVDVSGQGSGPDGLIGEGAYASVRRLRHKTTGEIVALKIVEKQPLIIRDMLPQMGRELQIQGALQHRHILRLFSNFEDELYVYLLLEYCGGGTLRGLCLEAESLRLSEQVAARYVYQTLQGVAHMHACSCAHRDLKPDNILLTWPHREVRICDFGWSAEVLVERALLTACGTPNYWAPEQFQRLPQGFHTDIWAMGNLIYEILVGHAPFWGSQEEIQQKVLSVDVRFPPGLLTQDAMHAIHCHLQYEPAARAPAVWMLTQHPWLQEQRHAEQLELRQFQSPNPQQEQQVLQQPQHERGEPRDAE